MLNTVIPSLEMIRPQGYSPLANQLSELFQEVIDIREQHHNLEDRVRAVERTINDQNFITDFQRIVSDNTGLQIKELKLSTYFTGNFATFCEFDGDSGVNWWLTIQRMSGYSTYEDWRRFFISQKNEITAEDMKKLADALDPDSGRFNPNAKSLTISKDNKTLPIEITIFFDPYAAFLVKEVVHKKHPYMTAMEITAVVLHELGHTVTTLERGADLYYRANIYQSALTEFNKRATKIEKRKFGAMILQQQMPEMMDQIKHKYPDVDEYVSPHEESAVVRGIETALDVILNLMLIAFYTFCKLCSLNIKAVTTFLFGSWEKNNYLYQENGKLRKHSDYYRKKSYKQTTERLSDAYATRHGVGAALITALDKLFNYVSNGAGITLNQDSNLSWALSRLAVLVLVSTGEHTGGVYPEAEERRHLIINQTLEQLKNSNLPAELKAYHLQQYEAARQASLKRNSNLIINSIRCFNVIRKIMNYILTAPTSMIVNGRFGNEYEQLLRELDDLEHNSLYYWQQKLS